MFDMLTSKTEKMSNTDIKKIIQEEYKIDVDAIRNLSKLANDLTVNNKLIVPGGLEIEGKLSVKGDVNSTGNGYFGPAYIGKYDKTEIRLRSIFSQRYDIENEICSITRPKGAYIS